MPYTSEELKNRPSYQNIIDADKNELKKFFEDEEIKAQQSGSTIEAVKTLRGEEGFILSYEDPDNLGNTMKSSIQKVRLPMQYFNTVPTEVSVKLKEERTFGDGFRPVPDGGENQQEIENELENKQAELDGLIAQNQATSNQLEGLRTELEATLEEYKAKVSQG